MGIAWSRTRVQDAVHAGTTKINPQSAPISAPPPTHQPAEPCHWLAYTLVTCGFSIGKLHTGSGTSEFLIALVYLVSQQHNGGLSSAPLARSFYSRVVHMEIKGDKVQMEDLT